MNPSSVEMIKNRTDGFGVDYIFSSSMEDQLKADFDCLSDGGTLIVIEPFDMDKFSELSQKLLSRGAICKSIFLENILTKQNNKIHLMNMINQDLTLGVIVPLPSTIFESREIEMAFRTIESSEKVLIKMPHQNSIADLNITPRFVADPKTVYIITGGLGGLGLELMNWIIMRGAKTLCISSRKGPTTAYQRHRLK